MDKALENLEVEMTGTRPSAPGTRANYMSRARDFLRWKENGDPPTRMDINRYFAYRRGQGDSDRTLATTFSALKKLCEANEWEWPLTGRQRPRYNKNPTTPAFTEAELLELIRKRDLYTEEEQFYLAMSSTYALRREELSRITRRIIRDNTVMIYRAKGGEDRRQLIPKEIMPVVKAWKDRPRRPTTLSIMFHRILKKAGMEKGTRWGWHCIRTTLDTIIPMYLARSNYPPSLYGQFGGWARERVGAQFLGASMAGVYSRPEILDEDPYGLDRIICQVSPFVKAWSE